jgi:hypothetical protein
MTTQPTRTAAELIALTELLSEVKKKLWLAQTSHAAARGTNRATIEKRETQIQVLERLVRGEN